MKYFYLLFLILLLGNCTPKEQSQGTVVDFGAFTKISDNQLLEQYRFVKLETNESCLLGAIDQIEVFANKIYIKPKAYMYLTKKENTSIVWKATVVVPESF